MQRFSIEITIDAAGVRAVRIYGKDWEQSAQAYALLERVSSLIQKLDAIAKDECKSDDPACLGTGVTQ